MSLHPELVRRVGLVDADLGGRVRIVSGERTYAAQKHLYDGWRAGRPGFNLAANPDRTNSDGSRGSRHMTQAAGYVPRPHTHYDAWRALTPDGGAAWAVDLNHSDLAAAGYADDLARAAARHGLRLTVPGEPWHYEPDTSIPPEVSDMPPRPVNLEGENGRWFWTGSLWLNVDNSPWLVAAGYVTDETPVATVPAAEHGLMNRVNDNRAVLKAIADKPTSGGPTSFPDFVISGTAKPR